MRGPRCPPPSPSYMCGVTCQDPAGWRDVADLPPARRQQLYEFFRTYKVRDDDESSWMGRARVGDARARASCAVSWSHTHQPL